MTEIATEELKDYDYISGKRKRTLKSTKKQIAEYWCGKVYETELNFDWSDALDVCWNCGTITNSTQKCHIVPHMLGGEDVPSNYVLLCEECHEQAPDVTNSDAMWKWIKSNRTKYGMYNTYKFEKALMDFEKIYGYDFLSKLTLIDNPLDQFKEGLKTIGSHGGRIKISSYVYMFEKILKDNKL